MKLILILAAVAALGLTTVMASPPANNPNASVTVEASVNPSAVGEEVTFTIAGLDSSRHEYTATVDGGPVALTPVNGEATISYAFTAAGTYQVDVYSQRGRQVRLLGTLAQVVN